MLLCVLPAMLFATSACKTTQVFRVSGECRPHELPLRRTVTLSLRGEPTTRLHGFLDSADRDSIRLASSITQLDDYQVIACRDVASISFTFKDREESRKVAKAAGGTVAALLVAAVLATCLDDDAKCDFLIPLWEE
jgi:hypothetical protein